MTNEKWSVAIEIDKEFSAELSEMNSVKVRFLKDDEYLWANVSVVSKDDHYYGILSFNNSMVRYAEERYLDLELILEDETGLKIPKTAKVEKEFFLVPESEEYYIVEENTSYGLTNYDRIALDGKGIKEDEVVFR